jgi:hypothetical protein
VPISVTMGQCYKTWYGHNSWISVKS